MLYRYILRPLLSLALRTVALWNPKGRRGVAGRRAWRDHLAALPSRTPGWFRLHIHAASVGEFEQAKPIIEELRKRFDGKILVTASFYSPSGYHQQKDWPGLDAASFLPEDRPGEMAPFVDRLDPDLVLIVRYDLWPCLISTLGHRQVPVALVSAVLRGDSSRFHPLLRPHFRRLYSQLALICAVGEQDAGAFGRLAPGVPVVVAGETRYDRVAARAAEQVELPAPLVGIGREGRKVLVAGSTWPPDEELLEKVVEDGSCVVVLVPHEPGAAEIADIERRWPGGVRLSRLREAPESVVGRPIIVDSTGLLSALYRIGTIAYVGGGFGAGVHSLLEPAAYGLPVLSGPRIERSADAVAMLREGVLQIVHEPAQLLQHVNEFLDNPGRLGEQQQRTIQFVQERSGATRRTVDALGRGDLLTPRM